ncbi:amino acid--tRNA ligase-related protein [Amycolatopsis saalfeldensis]|uniref:Lysyl-tRNA synthetase, class 2 n=1 Tax=Amycolatopsis saalfeldensis TaxID=394193 RepID=A0A1H8YNY4_9PSEU|nr:amino acid--tRNA ligase-related protein [Amycolatopsis saalfeldensis]SEP53742.1 lysyl-tRNA synthetase, class 2 [Amycolatopsis saalfeldensis]
MPDPIATKSELLASLRATLRSEKFVEVVTPVARKANLGPGRRAPAEVAGERYLRTMIGPALRVNLEFHPRVYEIGPCFRPEKPDKLHAPEFTMLDLYAAHESFDFLIALAERLTAPHIRYTPVRISVADHIRDLFGIDLRREPLGDLPVRMADRLRLNEQTPFKAVLGQFVEHELETQSTRAAVFLTDYPIGGDEPCARLTPGATATLNRFELLVDGIEVVHGYEDEVDGHAFAERARAVDLYDDEQALAWEAITAGRVPAASVGLGIGIERLCMAATGIKDIGTFLQSSQF